MDNQLTKNLYTYFGFTQFRAGQQEIIEDVLRGKNVLGILPTGSGKSICYQLPARLLPGTAIVVSPLISLMIDQVKQMKAAGFKEVIAFNSFMDFREKRRAVDNLGDYKLIYASPEMLQNERFINRLKNITISLFVIDEAHCISQWGHEFRPDYLKLSSVIGQLHTPPVMALSATATPEVQEDIVRQLMLDRVNKHVYPMDRKNITLVVREAEDNESKIDHLVRRFYSFPGPSMIYFSSREWTEKAASVLRDRLPDLNIAYYHGGMEQEDRILVQQQFTNGQLDLICCTSAFGMGIDKPDIRLVVHFHLPAQIESFIQESGRAGRDGKQSVSLVLLARNDEFIPRKLIESELPDVSVIEETLVAVYQILQADGRLPEESLLAEQLALNEVQWRFLRYHLEKSRLIGKKAVNHPYSEWKQAALKIRKVIEHRNRYKNGKLVQMLQWANGSECRRKSLFAPFQDSVQPPEYDCCDICGFQLENWQPEYKLSDRSEDDWQKELQKVMLRETVYAENE